MNKIIDREFVNMCKQGIIGAFLGIIFGAILGVLIYWIQFLLLFLTNPAFGVNMEMHRGSLWTTASQPGSLGSGFGAIIGSIFGTLQSLKSSYKK